jgi:hypothetical protein
VHISLGGVGKLSEGMQNICRGGVHPQKENLSMKLTCEFFCFFSGRHWLNTTLLLLSGSVKYWKEGDIEAIEYKTGDSFTFHSGSTGCLGWKANTWVLEYGRGFLPMSMPAIISDGLFTSFDVIGIFKMFRAFGVAYYYELKSEIGSFVSSI